MSISKQFKILSVKAEPQLYDKENVITFVIWAIQFDMDGYSNRALIETVVNFDPESAFTPAQELTKEQILSWVISAQGGETFLEQLEYHHTLQLQSERARDSLVDLPLPFVEGAILPTEPTVENNTSAFKLASDREYIRGLVLDALAEQSAGQISGM
jgi:hypothetical protein